MKKYIFLMIGLLTSLAMWAQEVDETTLNNRDYLVDRNDGEGTAYFSVWNDGISFTSDIARIPETITDESNSITYTIIGVRNLHFGSNLEMKIYLPNTATTISPEDPWDNYNRIQGVKTLVLSSSIEAVNNLHLSSVQKFEVDENNPNFSADDDGVLFSKDKKTLYYAPYGSMSKSVFVHYDIPQEVETIGKCAFSRFDATTRFTAKGQLHTVSERAFQYCRNLTDFIFENNSLTTIGIYAFERCGRLSNFDSDNTTLSIIGECAFEDCSSLSEFKFTDAITRIENYAFRWTSLYLSEFTLPANLAFVGYEAFNSRHIEKLIIPASLKNNIRYFDNNIFAYGSITSVYSYIQDPYPINDIFWGCSVGKIYIPKGETSNYASTDGWRDRNYEESTNLLPAGSITPIPEFVLSADKSTLTITSEGSNIYYTYTAEGTDPTESDTKYSTPISIDKNGVIKAIAVADGKETTSASYTVDWFKLEDVVITSYADADGKTIRVTMSTSKPDAVIKYIKGDSNYDWPSTPSKEEFESSEWVFNSATPPSVDANYWIYAYAYKDGYDSPSNVTSLRCTRDGITCKRPNMDKNVVDGKIIVSIATSTSGATIYYTKNGEDPTHSSEIYNPVTQLEINDNCTIKAVAVKDGMLDSDYGEMTINEAIFTAAVPTVVTKGSFDVDGNEIVTVEVTSTDEGATFWKRLNESGDWVQVTDPIVLKRSDYRLEIEARCGNFTPSYWSKYASEIFDELSCKTPSLGYDEQKLQVIVTNKTPEAAVYYILENFDETEKAFSKETWKVLTLDGENKGVITLDRNIKVRAIAVMDNWFNSSVANSYDNCRNWFNVAAVAITPINDGGQPKMQLSTTTDDADIYYSIDSNPYNWENRDKTIKDFTPYNKGEKLLLQNGQRVYAAAVRDGYNSTGWTELVMDYSALGNVLDAPSFSVNPETQEITISKSINDGEIYFTLDGSTPTKESSHYEGTFAVDRNYLIKAIVTKEDYINSTVSTYQADFSAFTVANVTFEPTYEVKDQATIFKVKLHCATENATIWWGIDNYDHNTPENNTKYNDGDVIEIPQGKNLFARATRDEWYSSENVTFNANTEAFRVGTPNFTQVQENKKVYINCGTDGATIYYTTNGNDPSVENGIVYDKEKGIDINANWTIKAFAVKDGMYNSYVGQTKVDGWFVTKDVDIKLYVNNENKLIAELSCEEGAAIYYTYDNSWYSQFNSDYERNAPYTGPFEVENDKYIRAAAVKKDFNRSNNVNEKHVRYDEYTCNTPSIDRIETNKTVIISQDLNNGYDVYYTIDGTEPTKDSGTKLVEESVTIELTKNSLIQARAFKEGMFSSSLAQQNITDWFRCENVKFEQVVVDGQPRMQLTSPDGGKIFYCVRDYYDDDFFNNNRIEYTGEVLMENSQRIWAKVEKEGYISSDWSSEVIDYGKYDNVCESPTITADSETRKVTIESSVSGASIYYTLDGTTPIVADSLKYTEPIVPTVNCTVRAIASAADYVNSTIAENYNVNWFKVDPVSFSPSLVTDADGNTIYKVSLKTITPDADIYYGINGRDYYSPTNNTAYEAGSKFTAVPGQRVYAIAVKDGYNASDWQEFYISDANFTVANPTSTINSETKKVFFSAVEGATIYYTLDGSAPDTSKVATKEFKDSIQLAENLTLKAIAIKPGLLKSGICEVNIYDWFNVSNVIVDIVAKNDSLFATFATANNEPNVKFYYKKTNYSWDSFDDDYTKNEEWNGKPLYLPNDRNYIFVGAVKAGYNNSVLNRQSYSYDSYTCRVPNIYTYGDSKEFEMTCETADATIYYTLDGTEPVKSEEQKYTLGNKIKPTHNVVIRAKAFKDDWFPSGVSTNYDPETWFKCANVVMEQIVDGTQPKMRLTSTDENAKIFYNINNFFDDDLTLNNVCDSGDSLIVENGETVYAVAVKDYFLNSERTSSVMDYSGYESCAAPEISGNSDTKLITMSTSDEKGIIYYTIDGRTPTENDSIYKEPIALTENCIVKAIVANDSLVNSEVKSYTVDDWFRVENVAFDPCFEKDDNGVTYKLRLKTATSGANIYYGIDGRDYYTPSGNIPYTDGDVITLSLGQWVYAIAERPGFSNSYWTEFYVNDENYKVAQPNVSADANNKVVYLSSTDGASIYYTLDGTDPDSTSVAYTDAGIKVDGNLSIRSIAYKDGMYDSDVRDYRVPNWFRVSDIVFEPVITDSEFKMRMSTKDAESGTTIYYSVGGYWDMDQNSDLLQYNAYNGEPFAVSSGQYVCAIAAKSTWDNSNLNRVYVDYNEYTCKTPSLVQQNDSVIFRCSTSGASIYYTTDGSDPKTSTTRIKVSHNDRIKPVSNYTIKAYAQKDGLMASTTTETSINRFVVSDIVSTPYVENNQLKMKLSTTNEEEDVVIYYTVGKYDAFDFNDYSNNTIYKDPFVVNDGNYVTAIAVKTGYNNSNSIRNNYNYSNYMCSTPTFVEDNENLSVILRCTTEGATIYYTIDGTDPKESSSVKSATNNTSVKLASNCTIKAYAGKSDKIISSSSEYTISSWFNVSDIVSTPYVENNQLKMKLSTTNEEEDVVIYYTVGKYDAFDFNDYSNNTIYKDPFVVNDGNYVTAIAVKTGYNNSNSIRNYYNYSNYRCSNPTFVEDNENLSVILRCATEGATIYYTIDGTDPKESTSVKSATNNTSVKLASNCTIKAYAGKSDKLSSLSSDYSILSWFNVSNVVFTPYVDNNKLKMKLSTTDEEKDVTIYYYQGGYSEFDQTTLTNNSVYTEPFDVTSGSYISVMATKAGYNNSQFVRQRFDESSYTCNQPSITTSSSDTTVVFRTSTADAVIYYTLDGTDPASSKTRVSCTTNTSVKLTANCTIKAICTKNGMINSSMNTTTYNSLQVVNPSFKLDGTKLTIATTTPGATIYYAFGDNSATTESTVYRGTFELPDNRRVSAIAVKAGWNNSSVSDYYPSNVVQCPLVKLESFDGHYMTLSAVDGATIYYRTDGNDPNNWNGSDVYNGPIKINQTGAVKARAIHPYMNESDVATFEVEAYASESGATTKNAGGLEASMKWAEPETIKEFTIVGPVNSDDISYLKNMTSLEKLDLTNAISEDGAIPDNAFEGLPLVWISTPNELKSVGNNIFKGCKELASVEWNTIAKIPDNAFDNDVNPNLLLFVPTRDVVPGAANVRNIIVNGTASNIYLSDGDGNNFYSPRQFYTQSITYTHDFTLNTGDGFGWETIALPFNCERFVHDTKGALAPFAVYNETSADEKGNYKPFWLRELTDIGFRDVKKIEANKPYIISMPNNESYATRYRVGGKVTFSATNVYVPQTDPESAQKGDVTLYANFMNNSETSDMLLLNTEADADHEAGSIFVLNSGRAVRPFEAYVISRARSRAYISMGDLGGGTDDDATAIKEYTIDDSDMVKVYNLSGVLVKQSSKEDALKGLAKGVYIVNGKRMIVK